MMKFFVSIVMIIGTAVHGAESDVKVLTVNDFDSEVCVKILPDFSKILFRPTLSLEPKVIGW